MTWLTGDFLDKFKSNARVMLVRHLWFVLEFQSAEPDGPVWLCKSVRGPLKNLGWHHQVHILFVEQYALCMEFQLKNMSQQVKHMYTYTYTHTHTEIYKDKHEGSLEGLG